MDSKGGVQMAPVQAQPVGSAGGGAKELTGHSRDEREDRGAAIQAVTEHDNPFAVARLPLTMRLGFRFKLLTLVSLNAIGILGVALLCVGPLNDFIEPNRFTYNLFSLFLYFASMILMAQAKVRRAILILEEGRVGGGVPICENVFTDPP